MTPGWVRLDNAAKIFPSVRTSRLTHLFRLAVRLDRPVDPAVLADAAAAVLPRFPAFQFKLRPGFFWYSLVAEASAPRPVIDGASPCLPLHRSRRGPHLLRVRWFGRRLAVEFSHALTDGIGGLEFVKALTAEYLVRTGAAADPADWRRSSRAPDPAEASDDFPGLFDPTFPGFETWDKAFLPPWPLMPRGRYAVTSGRLSAEAVRSTAQARKATVTEFLAATLLAAFQDAFLSLPEAQRRRRARPVRLVLPVNLRPVFASKTLRNFFVVVPVEIDLRLGVYEFDEILRKVHHQLQAEMDPKLLKKQIMRNLRGELNPVARILPLPLKNLVLSAVYGSYERRHTASLSNLGRLNPPEGWDPVVRGLDFTPPPSPFCRVNAGVVTWGDELSVTFGSLMADRRVERFFFTRLRRQGLAVSVESNRFTEEEDDALLSPLRR